MTRSPSLNTPGPDDRVALRVGDRRLVIAYKDIAWVRARNNWCDLHARGGRLLVRHSLKTLREWLPSGRFIRTNRSELANVDWIAECRPKSHGDCVVRLLDGTELKLSRTRRREVLAALAA